MTRLSVCVSYQCVLDRSHCMGHFSPFFTGTGRHASPHTRRHTQYPPAHMHACTATPTHTQCFDVNASRRGVQSTAPPPCLSPYPPLFFPSSFIASLPVTFLTACHATLCSCTRTHHVVLSAKALHLCLGRAT